jgi:hypothetical protein
MPAERTVYSAGLLPQQGRGKGWWTLSAGMGLGAMILLLLPGRKRYRRTALGLGVLCVLSFTMGCNNMTTTTPVATTTHVTVTSTKVASNGSITVSATVTGGTPAGNVQFFADGTAIGSAVPVSNGTTGNITVTAAQAPAFLNLVGTHSLSAHYLGDTSTQASQSGSLSIAITGSTTVGITGTSGSTTANGTINLTIN